MPVCCAAFSPALEGPGAGLLRGCELRAWELRVDRRLAGEDIVCVCVSLDLDWDRKMEGGFELPVESR